MVTPRHLSGSSASHVYGLATPEPRDLPYSEAERVSWRGWYLLGVVGIHLTEIDGKLHLSVDKFLPQPMLLMTQGGGEMWLALDPDIRVSAPTAGAPAERIRLQFGDMPIVALRSEGRR